MNIAINIDEIDRNSLIKMQKITFKYFLYETHKHNGLVLDKQAKNWPSSIAATGFGLACYTVAVKRKFISRKLAIKRILATLHFFWNSHQGTEPDATGYKGFYYHFLDIRTGKRTWHCELSTVDTAFLMAGILTVRYFFTADTPEEIEIRQLSDQLYRRVDWQWAQNGGDTITHGWTPENGFLPFRWEGYDEAMLLYILALGSPSFPVNQKSYQAWCKTYRWENHYGFNYLYSGSFFTHQLSHIWIDFRAIQDAFMRKKKIDYFENSRRATYVQQQYALANPMNFFGYSDYCWGITASDGPGPDKQVVNGIERIFYDYIARGVPYGPDDGTIAPWAVVASLPFAPEIVLPTIKHFMHKLKIIDYQYGFRATFNQSYLNKNHSCGWVSPWHFGINEGPIILMIENYDSEFVWDLMRGCPYLKQGLMSAGFRGGWLET